MYVYQHFPHAPEAEMGDVLDLVLAIAGEGLGERREGARAAAVAIEEEVGLVAVGKEARDGVQLRGGLGGGSCVLVMG